MNQFDTKIARKVHYDEFSKFKPKDKIFIAEKRIKEFLQWAEQNDHKILTISFSGGKDSTVLLDLLIKVHNAIKCKIKITPIYAIEITFPETLKFITSTIAKYQKISPYLNNINMFPPKKPWHEILQDHGYPIFSKQTAIMLNRIKRCKTKNGISSFFFGITPSARYHIPLKKLFLLDDNMHHDIFFSEKCCDHVKGTIKHDKRPGFVGTTCAESFLRKNSWINHGCNIFDGNHQISRPLSIWQEADIWGYIKTNNLATNPIYNFDHTKALDKQNLRFNRLGCSACPNGAHIEELRINRKFGFDNWILSNDNAYKNRFEKLKELSPSIYKSQIWMTGMYKVLIDMNVKIRNDLDYKLKYEKRWDDINNWYSEKNLRRNIIRVLVQVENSINNNGWKYTLVDINKALSHYKQKSICLTELEKIRKQEIKQINRLRAAHGRI